MPPGSFWLRDGLQRAGIDKETVYLLRYLPEHIVSHLQSLIENFNPRREFACSHTKIEVDGVFARVPQKDDPNGWAKTAADRFEISIEDLLQDPAIIRSARVSTGRDSTEVSEKAQGLVNFLKRDRHVTPFEGGVMFRLRVETPICFAQPFFRLFASFNEFSGRYSVIDGAYYTPANQSTKVVAEFDAAEQEARRLYGELVDIGVAKEMARYVQLYRFYTKFYMTVSLRELFNFLSWWNIPTRHEHTEFSEIRSLIAEILRCWTPWAYKSHCEHPQIQDFSWVANGKPVLPQPYILPRYSARVLDYGRFEMIGTYGSDALCVAALDDFPNPAQAFDHAGIQLRLAMPIHVFRQWVRHRKGAWTELAPNFDRIAQNRELYLPDRFRVQEGKVGAYTYSPMNDSDNEIIRTLVRNHYERCCERYHRLRVLGVEQEIAALVLPYVFYIETLRTEPLGGSFNFLSLRCDSHAQAEIRAYGECEWDVVKKEFPLSAKLFARYLHYGDFKAIKEFAAS
ncbi:MAG TPA: FAD-dependent thymidylate synthase [Candidatus Paceibacterota bacterium]|nr:FAD-dependent thymidylate synthase [Candidatus Paceibacterota bacterium]